MQYPPYQQPPYPPQPPYQQPYVPPPPPQPKQGLSGAAVALIILGVVAALGLFICVPLGIGAWSGFQKAQETADAAKKKSAVPAVLTESYSTGNHLLTAHYPSDFAAKALDDATLLIVRNFDDGHDEGVTLAAVKNPITNDPHEFARILIAQSEKKVTSGGGTFTKTAERETRCLDKYTGVEVEATFAFAAQAPYEIKACFFIRGDKGYEVRFDVPRSRVTVETPLLTKIIAATDFPP